MEYQIIQVSEKELLDVHFKGYRNRYISLEQSKQNVLEVFEVNQPPTIYLNVENTKIENDFVMAHCMGHIYFAKQNVYLKELKVPRLTVNELIPYMEYEHFNLFLNVMRNLATTQHNLSSRFIAPMKFFQSKKEWFEGWQVVLLKMIDEEARYFDGIKKTIILNEGFAVHKQDQVLKQTSTTSAKLEICQLNAQLHYKPEHGLNIYSLGKILWQTVSKNEYDAVIHNFDDNMFIQKYYTETVHEKTKLSFVHNRQIYNDYQNVKKQLVEYISQRTNNIFVDQIITEESGYLTLRYQNSPYTMNNSQITILKNNLEKLLNRKVYIKPLSSF
ncbi:SpoVR family protein [Piscibacillus sp. B03]|uniref:SpoVR family protein n=1 Tax=Piscibacillus sp. B03 TaxID=3457430 RepID=UPI003FCDAB1B